MVKEEFNSSKFKRPKDLYRTSKLYSKDQKPKPLIKIMNIEAILAVMKLI